MNEERRQILDMLSHGKINVQEADRLLAALHSPSSSETGTPHSATKPKYLRVLVEGTSNERVNIRVPMQLLRAGVRLASLIPVEVQSKVTDALSENGVKIDLKNLKAEDLEELVDQLSEISIDVEQDDQKVRVFCE